MEIREIFDIALRHGVTQSELARRSGISRMSLNNWDKGRNVAQPEHIGKVKDALFLILAER
jgi:transcriptional regulator with XRE-family HTH domain